MHGFISQPLRPGLPLAALVTAGLLVGCAQPFTQAPHAA